MRTHTSSGYHVIKELDTKQSGEDFYISSKKRKVGGNILHLNKFAFEIIENKR